MNQAPHHFSNGYQYLPDQQKLLDANGQEIQLRPQSLQVLNLLVSRQGEVVGKQEIFDTVWKDVSVTDDSLVQCIGDIRRALGDDKYKILVTVPRRGYKLLAIQTDPSFSSPSLVQRAKKSPLFSWIIAGFILLATAGFITWDRSSTSQQELASTAPSIAILRFKNLTDNDRWARLADGLTSDIANELARNHWLFVTAPGAADKLVTDANETETGQALKVRFVLGGTVQAESERLRITARLTDVRSGKIVWSERWERPATDIFKIQDEILVKVDGTLGGAWTGIVAQQGLNRAKQKPVANLDAYELFLLGTEHKHKYTAKDYEIAVGYLEKAIEIDPDYTKALATLAVVRGLQSYTAGSDEARKKLLDIREALTLKAIASDPDDPDALVQLNFLKARHKDYKGAEEAIRHAVEVAPNNPDILANAAWVAPTRSPLGRDAIDWAQRAMALHPSHPAWYKVSLGIAAFHAGDYALSLSALQEAPQMLDRHLYAAAAAGKLGKMEEAQQYVKRLLEQEPEYSILRDTSNYMPEMQKPLLEGAKLAGLPVR